MMETLELTDQKVTEDIYFYDFGEDEGGFRDILWMPGALYEGQPHHIRCKASCKWVFIAMYEGHYDPIEEDASYPNRWMKGMINGMAVTALMWGALWVVGKLVFG